MKYIIHVRNDSDTEVNWASHQAGQINQILCDIIGDGYPSVRQRDDVIRRLRKRFPTYIFEIKLT